MALLTASIVLFGVALLAGATLRSLQDGISLTHSVIDRELAQKAAEAALQDAAAMLTMTSHQLPLEKFRGAHQLGEITGAHYPFGGPMQSCEPPDYVVDVVPLSLTTEPGSKAPVTVEIYRVTARGKGYSPSTTVILQADFELRICPPNEGAVLKSAQDEALEDAECAPGVRQLAWRVIQKT